jgi:dTDP-glucose 4,6-dehydratase
MSLREQTVLVTGGAGFIGSHFVERLIASGSRVVNLDLLTYAGNPANLAAVARSTLHAFVHGDIRDTRLVSSLLDEHRPAVVVNIAAETHVDRSIDDTTAFIETNVTGVCHLLQATRAYWNRLDGEARRTFRFVQMSTDEVYGSTAEGAFNEDSGYAPNSPYAASKAAGDHMTRAYGITYGLPTIIVHASNTYGPRQHPEKLIPHTIISALHGRSLPLYGQGLNVRDWLYVGDLVRGLEHVAAAGQAGHVYNFACCQEWKNLDTMRRICAILDRLSPTARPHEAAIKFVDDRPGHDLRYAMSIDKVRRTLGWEPGVSFSDGLQGTVDWYVNNRVWWQSILDRGYSGARIGLGQ